MICDVDIQEIKGVRVVDTSHGKAFIVTLKDRKVAKSLHNNGRGNCRFYDSNKFEFFPVKKEISVSKDTDHAKVLVKKVPKIPKVVK